MLILQALWKQCRAHLSGWRRVCCLCSGAGSTSCDAGASEGDLRKNFRIQIGYCNGHNVLLNAVEYHRSSEINVAATDAVLILGSEQDITDDFHYDTSLMEAFKIPKGTAVEIYGTTLHYAPCDLNNEGFKVTVVLPKGTNEPLDEAHKDAEDKLITAKNKWLIAHAEGGQDPAAFIGLVGKNLNINE